MFSTIIAFALWAFYRSVTPFSDDVDGFMLVVMLLICTIAPRVLLRHYIWARQPSSS
jgi:hypothetical protein